jgi:hypothetical protein
LPVAQTENHRAQAGPHNLYRNRLFLVGDQGHFGDEGKDPRHLTDDSGIVNDRLPGDDLVLLPLVDDDAPRVGIAGRIENLCQLAACLLPLLDASSLRRRSFSTSSCWVRSSVVTFSRRARFSWTFSSCRRARLAK